MELWIRSQDKELLTKIEGAYYDYQQEKHHISVFTNNDYHWVGIYKTKERALEVLDEIQSIIVGKYVTSLNPKIALKSLDSEENAEKMLLQMAVYEMPKE